MSANSLPSEQIGIIGTIDPDNYTAGDNDSNWADAGNSHQVLATVMVGTIGASGTVDAKLLQATDSTGTGAKDVPGTNITQLTQAGGDSQSQVLINIRGDDLDTDNDYRFVLLRITTGVAASDCAGLVQSVNPRYAPASDDDLASVVEIVTA